MTLEDFDGGRFPGAVVAEQAVHLALGHVEGDPVDGGDGTVGLAQFLDDDRGHDALSPVDTSTT